jgi:DNA-binding MarR family transcriptional regulator
MGVTSAIRPHRARRPSRKGHTGAFVDYWLDRRPDLDEGDLATALTVARIGLMDQKAVDRAAQSCGVTGQDYSLLTVIQRGRAGEAIRPSDLSKLFDLPPSVITYRITQLVERGLVGRAAKPGDRRAILLHLTKAGERVVSGVMTEIAERMGKRLAALDDLPGGRDTLLELLGALAERWEAIEADGA